MQAERQGEFVSTFTYDYLGRRVKKAVDSDHDGVWDYRSYFVYDGWNVIREVREDNGGAATTKRYVWGMDLSQSMQGAGGIGGLLAVVDGDQSVFTFDGNGNVSEVLGASDGAEQAHYEYDAFGNTVVMTGLSAEGNPWRFSTKPVDEETGYSYYGYRWYVAELGRWNRRDPIEEQGGVNLYGMVGNRVIDSWDILGWTCAGSWRIPANVRSALDRAYRMSSYIDGWGDSAVREVAGTMVRPPTEAEDTMGFGDGGFSSQALYNGDFDVHYAPGTSLNRPGFLGGSIC